ncbi:AlpA family transcriptional regulator [Chromobacterium sp. Panama]|uniref:helix-turn-helix transcriptional regulator n=1 Tax=Chromobacterium sp. Panama TaxID=2161826 RepID=UPI000D313DB6|nr:AlpA family phage regulatory protein [Chromobacterium sp. Panama]PTU64212.1 AlpA family transcriptional regulator [Chromobacterium sp. Panama]
MSQHFQSVPTILRRKLVEQRTGLARSTIYDKMSEKSPRYDPSFPTPINLGPNSIGWIEAEVNAWIESRMQARCQGEQ